MQQLSNNFAVLALIFLLQGVLQIQSAKAFLENTVKSSHGNENEDNLMYTDMLASILRFIHDRNNLERDDDDAVQITLKDLNDDSEMMYQTSRENQITDQSDTSNPFVTVKRHLFANQNSRDKSKLSYAWGSNPSLWRPLYQPITAELPATLSKNTYYRPTIISPESRWESNPSFWGKRDFWTTRGKKSYRPIGSLSKIVEKDPENISFWKSRGKREEDNQDGRSSGSPWTPEELVMEPSYWPNRGKKTEKRDVAKSSNLKRELEKYWTARGRRRMDEKQWKQNNAIDGGIPYWVPRGKKNII